jgi:hypothetical protein
VLKTPFVVSGTWVRVPFIMRALDRLSALSADATSQLNVLGHDGHALRVNGAQVGVLEQTDQVGFSSLLEGSDGGRLKAEIGLEVLSNLTNQALEGQLAEQQLSALLVATDFAQSDGSGAKAMGLLHSSSSGASLAGSFGSNGLAGSLSSGGLAV